MKGFYLFCSIGLILLSSSCAPRRNLVYFSDLANKPGDSQIITADTEPKIQTNDLLSITVNTLSTESNLLFTSNSNNISKSGYYEKEGYRVDKDGNISLKGKQGVLIMLDGKPSYLTGQDLANLLKT